MLYTLKSFLRYHKAEFEDYHIGYINLGVANCKFRTYQTHQTKNIESDHTFGQLYCAAESQISIDSPRHRGHTLASLNNCQHTMRAT